MLIHRQTHQGFTLLELLVVLVILAAVAGLSSPYMQRFYDAMRDRAVVRDLETTLGLIRHEAIMTGEPQDFVFSYPAQAYGRSMGNLTSLRSGYRLDIISALEVANHADSSIIRFYPDGSASGGSLEIRRFDNRPIKRLRVDWLLGRISQHPLDEAEH